MTNDKGKGGNVDENAVVIHASHVLGLYHQGIPKTDSLDSQVDLRHR